MEDAAVTRARAPDDRPATTAAGWGAVAVVLAVAVAVDPWGFRPFTTLRWAAVGIAVAVTAALAVAAAVPTGGRRAGPAAAAAAGAGRVPRHLLVAGGALLVCLLVATAAAVDPLTAVVGHPRRHLGLVGWLVAALAFGAGTRLTGADVRRRLGHAGVVAAAATGVTGLVDLAGWDPSGTHFAGSRVGGLLGQPVYLGAVTVLLAPLAAGVALDRGAGREWRLAAGAAALTCGATLVATQTRGAWLGAVLAAVVAWPRLGPRLSVWRRDRRRPVVLGFGLAVAAITVAVAALAGGRAVATLDPDAAGGRGRIDEWVVASRVVLAHPLTGVGPEGYRIIAPGHVDDGYARRHGRDEVIDRAHSAPLDVAASAGIPAGVLYVVVLGGVMVGAARVARRSPDPVLVGAAAGVVAWAGQQATAFPIAEVDPLAWLLAGVVVSTVAARPAPRARAAPTAAAGTQPTPGPPAARWAATRTAAAGVAGVAAVVVGVAVAALGWTAVAADRDLRTAERALAARDPAAAVAAADRATGRRPDDIDAWYVAARVAASPAGLPAVDAGLDRVEDGLRRAPDDPALQALRADLLVERALRSTLPDDLAAAERATRARIAADPAGPRAHRQLGLVLDAAGRPAEARDALARALDLDPGDAVAEQVLAALDDGAGAGAGADGSGEAEQR